MEIKNISKPFTLFPGINNRLLSSLSRNACMSSLSISYQ